MSAPHPSLSERKETPNDESSGATLARVSCLSLRLTQSDNRSYRQSCAGRYGTTDASALRAPARIGSLSREVCLPVLESTKGGGGHCFEAQRAAARARKTVRELQPAALNDGPHAPFSRAQGAAAPSQPLLCEA
jgi:hypothetical protein